MTGTVAGKGGTITVRYKRTKTVPVRFSAFRPDTYVQVLVHALGGRYTSIAHQSAQIIAYVAPPTSGHDGHRSR